MCRIFVTIDEGTRLSGEPRLAGYAYILAWQSPAQLCADWKRRRDSTAVRLVGSGQSRSLLDVSLMLVRRMEARTGLDRHQAGRDRTIAILVRRIANAGAPHGSEDATRPPSGWSVANSRDPCSTYR
ncbi:hypothetical protein [Paenibacillus elgii]|uniref:hypothetical protein n=1 Tax=Paenibacillus elgii TaxID=189691 RepID=UPI0030DA53A9